MTTSDMFLMSPLLPSPPPPPPPAVQYQPSLYGGNNNNSGSPLSSRGSSAIVCERCGEVCRGEVVRVKNTHFHVHCFTCQGKQTKNKTKISHTPTRTFSGAQCSMFFDFPPRLGQMCFHINYQIIIKSCSHGNTTNATILL